MRKPAQKDPRKERILTMLMTPNEKKFKQFITQKRSFSKQSIATCEGSLFISLPSRLALKIF